MLYLLDGGKEEIETIKIDLGITLLLYNINKNPLSLLSDIIKQEWAGSAIEVFLMISLPIA
ncbi:hypothetical protein [Wolbachia endosymbiont of Brugia pahangi]|uniref:hypothetical protein n=1 Tax=Wolbachia endosymbiont of Brugia pahangi TaxID=96495 RepID=UPI0002E3DD19|nr:MULTISPECIES: hypothetical protein [unclassified Wolbachia]